MPIVGSGHRITITGPAAAVRLGYHLAATLGAWRLDGDLFTAAVVTVDGFRVTQSPLVLEIPNRDGVPTLRGLADVVVYQGQLSARLLKR